MGRITFNIGASHDLQTILAFWQTWKNLQMHQTWPNCNAKLQKQFARLLKFLKQASNNMAIECRKFITSNPLIQVFILNENQTKTQFNHLISSTLRRGRDSNPRYGCPYNGFRDRPDRPLWHLSYFCWIPVSNGKDMAVIDKSSPALLHLKSFLKVWLPFPAQFRKL